MIVCQGNGQFSGAAFGPAGRIGKQEVLLVYDEKLYAPFRPVIAQFCLPSFR